MGRKRRRSAPTLSGVLLLDKPVGPTSFDMVARARRALNEARIGHGGTLDPFASGLLPLFVGHATPFGQFIANGEKVYEATVQFGTETDSCDLKGEVVSTSELVDFTVAELQLVADGFVGEIEQTPPIYSAVKVNGRRLYEYARRGEAVEIPSRRVQVRTFEVLSAGRSEAEIRVTCGKGTYIRSIARDLARAAGTTAHLTQLRRLQVGGAQVADAVDEQGLTELGPLDECRAWIPLEQALEHLPAWKLDAELTRRVGFGQRISLDDANAEDWKDGEVRRAVSVEGNLLAVVERDGDRVRVVRGVATPSAEADSPH